VTAKNSFLAVFRIFLVLFSIQFVKEAFFKWEGYSYYMQFKDFLPDLSMAFILWIVISTFFAFITWLVMYVVFKSILQPLTPVRLEHIIFCFLLFLVPLLIKYMFFENISLGFFTGFRRNIFIVLGCIFILGAIWLTRKYTDKIISEFYNRLTPLFWFFVFIFILAIPFSVSLFLRSGIAENIRSSNVSTYEERPNIILVTWDSLTTVDMELYGYERPTTPFINEWSRDSIVFKRAYSTTNWTSPSVMTMMTSQRPWTHRVWYEITYNYLEPFRTNLPAILKDYGYSNYAFVQNIACQVEALGMGNEFLVKDKYHIFWSISYGWHELDWSVKFLVTKLTNSDLVAEWISESPLFKLPWAIYNFDKYDVLATGKNISPAEKVYDRFLEYISQNPKKPFFAWLHLFPPHTDYLPPKPYMGMFGDADKFNTAKKQVESKLLYNEYSPERQEDVNILRKRYDEYILYSDQQFKLFMLRLAEIIDMSDTIVIFSSDHGESFLPIRTAHGGPHLYEPFVYIPLIIKVPGIQKGKLIDALIDQVDIAPTILDFAGIPIPEWMEGRSLVPLIEHGYFESRPVFSMQLVNNRAIGNEPITKGTFAVWEGDYKLHYYKEEEKLLLFNLRDDPGETKDLSKERPEIVQRLKKLIHDNLSRANERITQHIDNN
jgi:arylsulfatase A-like enzyme